MYSYLKTTVMLNFLILLIILNLLKVLNAWFLKKLYPEMTIDDLIKYEKEANKLWILVILNLVKYHIN